MAGLETLDETSPKDTDPVSLGDDVIRETRQKTKTTVGLEHYLDGPHKIPSGAQSVRPAAGRAGRLFYNMTTRELQYDTGTEWIGSGAAAPRACILGSSGQIDVPQAAVDFPILFNGLVGEDTFGYANLPASEINQPANSMGMVSLYLEVIDTVTGYGATATVQQFFIDRWYNLVTAFVLGRYLSANTLVHSGYGTRLRCVMTNVTGVTVHISRPAVGNSPRLGYIYLGTSF